MYFTQLLLNKSTAIFFGLLLIFKSHDEQSKRKMSIVVMIENQMLKFKYVFDYFFLANNFTLFYQVIKWQGVAAT